VIFKKYQYGSGDSSKFDSQSIVKTFTAIAIGIALEKKVFSSIDERIENIVPELSQSILGKATIKNALQMMCGPEFQFSYDSDGDPAKYMQVKFSNESKNKEIFDYFNELKGKDPGQSFNYDMHCSDILSIALQRRTGKTLREFFEENVWLKLGAADRAAWLTTQIKPNFTSGGNSFFASLNDYIRMAIMLSNNCNFNGYQIVSIEYCKAIFSNTVSTGHKSATPFKRYGYQTWVRTEKKNSWYSPNGAFGQRIYIDPVSKSSLVVFALDPRHFVETDKFWENFIKN